MAQLSLYLDETCMNDLRSDAVKENLSISSYARGILEKRHDAKQGWINGWPPNYFDSIQPLGFDIPERLAPEAIQPLDV